MTRNWALVVECKLAQADLIHVRRADMARDLGVHDVTLGRHLVSDGTHWQELLDKERRRRCEAVLRANKRACSYRLMQRCGIGRQHLHKSLHRWFGATLTEIRSNPSILSEAA